jgi:hypothetical protein
VITPSDNQARFIRRTIESVLSQNEPDLQYLVFDGGSTDGTPDILSEYADVLTAVIERDAGQADAVNKGLRKAAGGVIGWLNSDDVYYPGACARVLDVFANRPEVDVVYGEADHIDEEDRVIEPYYTEPFNYERLKEVCFLCQPAVFFRHSVIDRCGVLQTGLRYCMDYEYWLRILSDRAPWFLQAKLAGSRLHADTKTLGSKEAVHREILEMLAARFGTPPARWIHNLAHVIVREKGFVRDTPDQDRRFVAALVDETEDAFKRYCGGVPLSEQPTLAQWRQYSGKAAICEPRADVIQTTPPNVRVNTDLPTSAAGCRISRDDQPGSAGTARSQSAHTLSSGSFARAFRCWRRSVSLAQSMDESRNRGSEEAQPCPHRPRVAAPIRGGGPGAAGPSIRHPDHGRRVQQHGARADTGPLRSPVAGAGDRAEQRGGNDRLPAAAARFGSLDARYPRAPTSAGRAGSALERWRLRRQARRYHAFEREYCRRFDLVVTVSSEDARWVMEQYGPRHVYHLPLPVDADYFSPQSMELEQAGRVVFTGLLSHPPNVDAAVYFATDVLPLVRARIPSAEFHIVGRNPLDQVVALGRLPGVQVFPDVPDIRAHIAGASVVVAPLRYGSGSARRFSKRGAWRSASSRRRSGQKAFSTNLTSTCSSLIPPPA